VDLGIGGAVSWDPNHTSEVEADAAVNVEFRWD
jgi:hypothetical protein